MKKRVLAIIATAAFLAVSCAPRYATCPTYAKKEVKVKQTEDAVMARK